VQTYKKGGQNQESRPMLIEGRVGAPSLYSNKETVDEISKLPLVACPNQSINKEDAQYFAIRSRIDPNNDKLLLATYFPSRNPKGDIIGYKKRDWTLAKEEPFHFTTVGSVKVSNLMFGQWEAMQLTGKRVSLIQVEGEGDVVAARRGMLDSLKGTKWEGSIEPHVVGLTCGAGNAQECIVHNEEFVRLYERYVLGLDNDCATPQEESRGIKRGKEATEDIASYLLMENICIVDYTQYKDPREMLDDGKGVELGKLLSFGYTRYSPEKILNLEDVSVERLRKKKKKGLPLRHFPKFTKMTGGPITGELWTLTGPSGAGKSTIGRDFEFDILNYLRFGLSEGSYEEGSVFICEEGKPRLDTYVEGEKIGIIRLEEDEEESINSLYAMDLGYDAKDFCGDPSEFITEKEHEAVHRKWIEEDRVKVFDHFGSLPINQLINKLKQLVFIYGCRWIVLDHLSMLVSGLRTTNEVKELDIIMTELAAFCKQHDVFILAVAHMKRKNFEPPKDRNGEVQSFFVPVRKEDLRGSASLEQLSWTVVTVEPEELPNQSRGRVRLGVPKNRRGKKLGQADTVWMVENGTFIDAKDWEVRDGCFMFGDKVMYRYEEVYQSPLPNQTPQQV
jgi:replicative DNA helicase